MSVAVATFEEPAAVFVLAQNRLLREALARILSKKIDLSVIGACDLSPLSLTQIVESAPHILVIDAFTINPSNAEFLRVVHRSLPELKIVMIGIENDAQAFMNLVREGALGFVLNDASATEVVETVRAGPMGKRSALPS